MTPKTQIEEISSNIKEKSSVMEQQENKNIFDEEKSTDELKMGLKPGTQVKVQDFQGGHHQHQHHHAGIERIGTDPNFKRKIVWFNTLGFAVLHLAALIGVPFLYFCNFYTLVWSFSIAIISGEGVTLGAHRFYSHKAFKATSVTKAVLLILQTIAGQNCMYIWVRDHRQHHKFSDTDADPHNANRGFFFSHIGWLMSRKHPEVIRKGKTIDMSDLEADKLVMFQKKYYKPLYAIFALAIPILTPVYLWKENIFCSFFVSYMTRYIIVLNVTWLVNSAAHVFGTKPYDRTMRPVECALVSLVTAGEGWHNYHHAFPWDYRAAELGMKFNFTTFVINQLARFGLVYDLKTAPYSIVEHRIHRTGDGSHPIASADVTPRREIQNANADNSVKNDDSEVKQAEECVDNSGGLVGSYEKCMELFVKGLEGEVVELKEDIVVENNNTENVCNKSYPKNKFEVCELGYNVIRQRPI